MGMSELLIPISKTYATERSADNDVVIETKAWGNEDNNAPIISNSYTVSFLGKNTNYTLVVYGAAGQVAELQRAFQKVFPLLAFIVFCVSLVTGWIFSHLITKPVLKISRISKEMSELQFEWLFERNSGFDCRKRFTNTP